MTSMTRNPSLLQGVISPMSKMNANRKGFVTMMMPRKDTAPAQRVAVSPENQALVDLINNSLSSRFKFKIQMKGVWQQVVGLGSADEQDLTNWVYAIEERLGLPVSAFGDLNQAFALYDFTGDGLLQFDEAYKLLRFAMEQHRKQLGGQPDINVPSQTPEEAGYDVLRVLGQGGQGTAMLVHNRKGEDRVLKVYDKTVANAVGINDLKEEMELLKKGGNNPNIAACHEVFQDQTHLYMVGDAYMGGDFETVQQRALKHDVDLDSEWYKHLFYQSFSGINYLHQKSVVHCDIKEPNIMVHHDEYYRPEVVIIDLGLATASLFGGPGAKGTPGYMPPETWNYGLWYPCGDVFSMGVVCFQMLANMVPSGKTGQMGLFQEGAKSLEDVATLTKTREVSWDRIPEEFDEVYDWLPFCLEKNIDDRMRVSAVLDAEWFDEVRSTYDKGKCINCTIA